MNLIHDAGREIIDGSDVRQFSQLAGVGLQLRVIGPRLLRIAEELINQTPFRARQFAIDGSGQQFLEMRWRVLSLAADLDRVGELSDERLTKLHSAIEVLLGKENNRAAMVQMIFSDPV